MDACAAYAAVFACMLIQFSFKLSKGACCMKMVEQLIAFASLESGTASITRTLRMVYMYLNMRLGIDAECMPLVGASRSRKHRPTSCSYIYRQSAQKSRIAEL